MRETLYIRLRSTDPDAPTAYCIAGSDAALSWPVQQARLDDVLARTAGRRTVVLVPGSEVRLTQVRVPARAAAKVLQAAPYALEEQLAEDIDELHFALGPRLADGAHAIAVVTRARMEQWLAPLRERGIAPQLLVSDLQCLPVPDAAATPPRWSALAEDEQISVRSDVHAGFACAPDDLETCLQAAGIGADTVLRIVVPRSFHGDFTRLQQPVELLPGFGSALEALLPNLHPEHAINLLQGAYSQRADYTRLWQPWRAAAVLLAAWIVLAAVNHGVQAWRLGGELAQQQQRNEERFRQLFPSEQRIVDLNAQLEQQARLLQDGGQKGALLPLLETLSAAMGAASGLSVQSLQFREGALFVSLTGSDLQQLESLRSWFAQHPSSALDVQSANSGGDGVQIRLRITPA